VVGQADGAVVPVVYAVLSDFCRCYFLYRGPGIESEPGRATAVLAVLFILSFVFRRKFGYATLNVTSVHDLSVRL